MEAAQDRPGRRRDGGLITAAPCDTETIDVQKINRCRNPCKQSLSCVNLLCISFY